jgi:hypothetical protein
MEMGKRERAAATVNFALAGPLARFPGMVGRPSVAPAPDKFAFPWSSQSA